MARPAEDEGEDMKKYLLDFFVGGIILWLGIFIGQHSKTIEVTRVMYEPIESIVRINRKEDMMFHRADIGGWEWCVTFPPGADAWDKDLRKAVEKAEKNRQEKIRELCGEN